MCGGRSLRFPDRTEHPCSTDQPRKLNKRKEVLLRPLVVGRVEPTRVTRRRSLHGGEDGTAETTLAINGGTLRSLSVRFLTSSVFLVHLKPSKVNLSGRISYAPKRRTARAAVFI